MEWWQQAPRPQTAKADDKVDHYNKGWWQGYKAAMKHLQPEAEVIARLDEAVAESQDANKAYFDAARYAVDNNVRLDPHYREELLERKARATARLLEATHWGLPYLTKSLRT